MSALQALNEIYEEACKSYANVEECHDRYVSLLLKVSIKEEELCLERHQRWLCAFYLTGASYRVQE